MLFVKMFYYIFCKQRFYCERGKNMKLKTETLEQLRIAKGKNNLSIGSIALKTNINRNTIGSIINGRTDGLSKQTINKIEAYLAKCK